LHNSFKAKKFDVKPHEPGNFISRAPENFPLFDQFLVCRDFECRNEAGHELEFAEKRVGNVYLRCE
jgi:hypothetical protein